MIIFSPNLVILASGLLHVAPIMYRKLVLRYDMSSDRIAFRKSECGQTKHKHTINMEILINHSVRSLSQTYHSVFRILNLLNRKRTG